MSKYNPPAEPQTTGQLLRRVFKRQGKYVLIGFPLLSFWQVGEALVPITVAAAIDNAILPIDHAQLLLWIGILAANFAFLSFSYRFGGRAGFRAVQAEAHELRSEIAAKALSPSGITEEHMPGEVLSLASSDSEIVARVIRQAGYTIGTSLALIVVSVWLLSVDVLVGLVVILGTPLMVFITQFLAPLVAKRVDAQQTTTAHSSGIASDFVTGIRPLKGMSAEAEASKRYREHSQTAAKAGINMVKAWGALDGLGAGLSLAFLAFVAVVAGSRAMSGDITAGEFIAVVGLSQFLAEPIRALGELTADFAAAWASSKRIVRFLNTPALSGQGQHLPSADTSSLVFDRLTTPEIRDLSLIAAPGAIIAIVVSDPSTVSSLLNVLSAKEAPEAGQILIGKNDIAKLTFAARRKHMIVAPHRPDLFEGSLLDTIDPDRQLKETELHKVLEAAACNDFIDSERGDLARRVSAMGTSFSGGQRQRLALARALGHDPEILILHEPTSSVDAVTEDHIAQKIREYRANRATIIITSSPPFLRQADEVLWLREGAVVARGKHSDLLHRDDYRAEVAR